MGMIDDTVFKNIVNERSIVTPGIKWIPNFFATYKNSQNNIFSDQLEFKFTASNNIQGKQLFDTMQSNGLSMIKIKLTKNQSFPKPSFHTYRVNDYKNWEPPNF